MIMTPIDVLSEQNDNLLFTYTIESTAYPFFRKFQQFQRGGVLFPSEWMLAPRLPTSKVPNSMELLQGRGGSTIPS